MKIVVEGFDATGKSTLVKALAERLGLSTHTAGPPPKDDLIAIMNCAEQLVMKNVVHDRITCVSRQAYQLDNSDEHIGVLKQFVKMFLTVDTVFIYAYHVSDNHEVKDYDTAEHVKHITDNQQIICDNYRRIFDTIPHIPFNFTTDSIEDVICQIAKLS